MIAYSHYSLTPKRHGALLQVDFGREGVGYADLHPWPELGDPPLADSLEGKGPLLERALTHARIDASYRSQGIPVPLDKVPDNHFLLSDLNDVETALSEGFKSVKWKVSALGDPLLQAIAAFPILWRLDGNNRHTKAAVVHFLERCSHLSHIEFFEDPFPASEGWETRPVPFAFDRGEEPASYDIRVFKPALHTPEEPFTRPVCVTSYLGHPLGQVADAFVAHSLAGVITSGLLSHRVYPTNRFSERLSWCGPRFTHPGGTGFGFDDLLANLPWRKRRC